MLSDQRLDDLIGEGPEGLAPELWQLLLEERHRRDAAAARGEYTAYEDVPWIRRGGVNSRLLLLGLIFPPAMWCVCGTLVTGNVYTDERNVDGTLKRWSPWNRVVAFVVFGLQLVVVAVRMLAKLLP